MAPTVVLVTGVSRHLGCRLVARLADDPRIERVIGVDTVPPPRQLAAELGRAEFVRADIRNPLIAKVISATGVDTVVHLNITATPRGAGGRTSMKEMNVIGTMQLLAACQKSASVRRFVLKSTTAVYGSSSRDPALFTEETEPKAMPRSGYGKDAVEVEGYVRGFARRRPDVAVGMLRFTNFIGPRIDSPLVSYLSLPVVPTILGFDPRVQLLHEEDALEVLRLATLADRIGTVNVGGAGVLLLSQMIRRAGRVPLPVPVPAVQLVGRSVRRTGLVDFSPEQVRFLEFGRVVDTTRLRTGFGYQPRFSTVQAFDDFVHGRGLRPVLEPAAVRRVEDGVLGALDSVVRAAAVGGRRG
ncbi:MAG TPA: NAD-dependent epimerase/dehydratase family protein [Mycobacteriales bacterium]|nr:NAD-dependent epimerase/dehydratase family protein [Mycobacteriales bacterium]